jgi:soluble lytic murein transglycosylase
LIEAGLHEEASAFIGALLYKADSPDDYAVIADFARDVGHYHDAVLAAKKAEKAGFYLTEHAFPTMLENMRSVSLEWALVHGLILQESGFNQWAVSPAGARGFMQLMPATAADVARRRGISHRREWLTERPSHNIYLGTAYLEEMLKRFDGSYVLALAAYNAGPNRVSRWLKEFGDPRKPGTDVVDWVEMIPVYETRNYVQRVLEAVYVYRIKLEELQNSKGAPVPASLR